MGELTSDIVGLIYHLLPGFLAAWVFYGLTAHPKRDAFERIVQALIFTVIVKAVNVITRKVWWSMFHDEGEYWTQEEEIISSVVVAIGIGLIFATCANNNFPHRFLNYAFFQKWVCRWPRILLRLQIRKHATLHQFIVRKPMLARVLFRPQLPKSMSKVVLTKRTTFPSEWYSALHRIPRYLVLHLDGNRRLKGWPEEWPDQPDKGHFVLMMPVWLLNDGREIAAVQTDRIVIAATEVKMIELLKYGREVKINTNTLNQMQKPLFDLQAEKSKRKGDANGIESTSATA